MKEEPKRIPCPHCKELILPGAIKCRYCGERIGSTKLSYSIKSTYWTWLTAVIFFFALVFSVGKSTTEPSNLWWTLWLFDLAFGIWAFIRLLRAVTNGGEPKSYKVATLLTLLALFVLGLNYHTIETKLGFVPLDKPVESVVPSPVVSSTPSFSPKPTSVTKQSISAKQVTCTGPDGKTFKTSQAKCDEFNTAWGNPPTPNPDEVIQCNIHANCGGGYKEVTRSVCDQMTCCSLKTGNILTSQSDCKNKQYNECVEAGMSAGLSLYYATEACKQYK